MIIVIKIAKAMIGLPIIKPIKRPNLRITNTINIVKPIMAEILNEPNTIMANMRAVSIFYLRFIIIKKITPITPKIIPIIIFLILYSD